MHIIHSIPLAYVVRWLYCAKPSPILNSKSSIQRFPFPSKGNGGSAPPGLGRSSHFVFVPAKFSDYICSHGEVILPEPSILLHANRYATGSPGIQPVAPSCGSATT